MELGKLIEIESGITTSRLSGTKEEQEEKKKNKTNETDSMRKVKILSLKAATKNYVDLSLLEEIEVPLTIKKSGLFLYQNYLVQTGDVIIKLNGSPQAAVIPELDGEELIMPIHFAVLKNTASINPYTLCNLLNSDVYQYEMTKAIVGSGKTVSLSIQTIKSLNVNERLLNDSQLGIYFELQYKKIQELEQWKKIEETIVNKTCLKYIKAYGGI